jgi:hypothetical protein
MSEGETVAEAKRRELVIAMAALCDELGLPSSARALRDDAATEFEVEP